MLASLSVCYVEKKLYTCRNKYGIVRLLSASSRTLRVDATLTQIFQGNTQLRKTRIVHILIHSF
jgi:hypothetical protein